MHQKEVTHSDGSYERKSRRRVWLTKWDKIKKSHDTLIDWCPGREWPVNCMTVISAWWRSNMPFQRLSGRLNYYITLWGQEVRRVGDQRSRKQDVVEKASRKLSPRASVWASGERERHTAISGGAYVPGPTFGFVKLLASSGSHCTKWADEQHWQAAFESRFVPDILSPLSPL